LVPSLRYYFDKVIGVLEVVEALVVEAKLV
jgi:hypothetical protein